MENEDTEYISGQGDDFITFLFSSNPREKNTVKLELDPPERGVVIGLHIFQELLMIFTDGMKYLFGDGNNINITNVTKENMDMINKYFESMGFHAFVEEFTVHTYLDNMKLPNYFTNQELIKDDTPLKDIYYETYVDDLIYRIYFDFCR